MKRLLFGILATLPLAYCMTGCSNDTDYGGFSYFIWANDSDHRITLSVAREYGELVIENEIIEPGESFESERVDGAIAYCQPPSSYIRYVEVVFEDGTKAIYIKGYQPPRDSDYYSRQDSTIDWNYEEEVTASHAVRTRWTYTFTNADYDAAVVIKILPNRLVREDFVACISFYASLRAACAAARRAMGTRNGEQLT